MASLRDSLLPMISQFRAIPGQLGLRQFTVAIRSGQRELW